MQDTTPDHETLVEELAAEYLDRLRAGENPSMEDYAQEHPQLARDILELFPTIAAMEGLKEERERHGLSRDVGELTDRLGEFRLLERIGRGGMGVVYRAVQEPLDREAAVKVISGGLVDDPTAEVRFLREARLASRLHHPHIVSIYGFGEQDGHAYYAMQYIRGLGMDRLIEALLIRRAQGDPLGASPLSELTAELLRMDEARRNVDLDGTVDLPAESMHFDDDTPARATDSISRDTALPHRVAPLNQELFREVALLMIQAARAMEYAHSQQVLHRDIKPANLLVNERGDLWIADFGMAKGVDSATLTAVDTLTGTLRYMAPEVFEGKAGPAADIYGLGMTMYELLAQRPAFDESRPGRLIRMIMNGDCPHLRSVNPSIPPVLAAVAHKAMATEPEDRFADAGEFAEDLELSLEHLDDYSTPFTPVAPGEQARFSRMFLWMGALLLLMLLGTLAMLFGDAFTPANDTSMPRLADDLQVDGQELMNEEARSMPVPGDATVRPGLPPADDGSVPSHAPMPAEDPLGLGPAGQGLPPSGALPPGFRPPRAPLPGAVSPPRAATPQGGAGTQPDSGSTQPLRP